MQDFTTPPSGFLKRATSPAWQDQLRATVRLYLSFSADPSLEQELDELLQRNEQELLDYLLAGEPPTPASRERAKHFLDAAQHRLLGSETEVARLLEEVAASRPLLVPKPRPVAPAAGAATAPQASELPQLAPLSSQILLPPTTPDPK
jgi:hypothetical protein